MDFTALDFETTAYSGGGTNDPWQLGITLVRDSRIVETREWFFGTDMTPEYEPIMAQWESFAPYLVGQTLVAHNIATERTILRRIAPLTEWGSWIATLKLARKRYRALESYSLGDVCNLFGLAPQMENRSWHDALYDAVACANLALFLHAGEGLLALGE